MPPLHILQGRRAILLDSWELQNIGENTSAQNKAKNPQRFFPISDSRRVPALSSTSHIHGLSVSLSFSTSWHLSAHPFSFVSPSVQAGLHLFVFAGSASLPLSVLPPPWLASLSAVAFLSSPPG